MWAWSGKKFENNLICDGILSLLSTFFILGLMFFQRKQINKKPNQSVLESSTNTLQTFWADSHWIPVNSFLWALNDMETMKAVVFNQFGLRTDYPFVRKMELQSRLLYSHSPPHPPTPWPCSVHQKTTPIYFLFGGKPAQREAFPKFSCFVRYNNSVGYIHDMYALCSRGQKQRFWHWIFFLKAPSITTHTHKPHQQTTGVLAMSTKKNKKIKKNQRTVKKNSVSAFVLTNSQR